MKRTAVSMSGSSVARTRVRAFIQFTNRDHVTGIAFTGGLAAAMGFLGAWLTPRGPLTTPEALGTMAVTFGLGLASAVLARSRWVALVAPVTLMAAFELGRLSVDGPTVDRTHLGSLYGILAFIAGRGFDGILALAPLMLGIGYGRCLRPANNRAFGEANGAPASWMTRIALGAGAFAMLGLAALLARPASTPAILGADGERLEGSIAELSRAEIGGHEQVMLIRGHSTDSPVLLYLAGGPGGTDLGAMRMFGEALEREFVVVTWDQRGTGKSYPAVDPTATLTVEQMVADTVEVTNHLRERFAEDRIYIVGNSWGGLLGVLAVHRHPELYYAYVGSGQMVSPRETDVLFYEDALAWAKRTGNDGLARTLRDIGLPPYEDVLNYEHVIGHERQWNDYPRPAGYGWNAEMPFNVFVRENTLVEQVRHLAGFMETFATLYPQVQSIDFRQDVVSLEVPVYIATGAHEARGRAELANEWFELLGAPRKERVVFERSGHRPHFEEPERFAEAMTQIVGETYPHE